MCGTRRHNREARNFAAEAAKTWNARCTLALGHVRHGHHGCVPRHARRAASVAPTQIADSIIAKSHDSALHQSCPRVIMSRQTRQIYISSTVDRCLTVTSDHTCGDCRVSQPGEWYMCRTFHVCNPTTTTNRWSPMRDIALLGCGPHCCQFRHAGPFKP